jgi:polyvinyl alcohol dehydrogenase (cytochrome)
MLATTAVRGALCAACVLGLVRVAGAERAMTQSAASAGASQCASAPLGNPLQGPRWNGWGVDAANTRYQPDVAAKLSAVDVPRLALKWAVGFEDRAFVSSQPTVVGGRIYVGTGPGGVRSLDAATGCEYWRFPAHAIVRTAVSVGAIPGTDPVRYAAYFGDLQTNVYAVDAGTGGHLWTRRVDVHPAARITGAPTLFEGRLYVPVSSLEEAMASRDDYECCSFRGQVVALDAATGDEIWRTYAIEEAPRPVGTNAAGATRWAPAGAAIWGAPTIDATRGVLYVGTGDAYTQPAADTTDAVMALDLETGRKVWVNQLTENDAWLTGCDGTARRAANCPDPLGPDHDFGQSPVLRQLPDGRAILAIGQKSGVGWGLDPDRQGAVVWQVRVGQGSISGGIQFGSAADERHVYFANSDAPLGPEVAGGLAAVSLETGELAWLVRPPKVPCETPRDRRCIQGQSAAVTAIPGVVFSGATNGIMRAYATADGRILWEHNTAQAYRTVNGVEARGGGIDGAGPTVVDGAVYFYSGYAVTRGGEAGNVLLAFAVP